MREVEIDLSEVEGIDNEIFFGKMKIKVMTLRQRLSALKDFDLGSDGEGRVEIKRDSLEQTVKLMDLAEKYIVELEIGHVPSDTTVSSFGEMESYPQFDEITTTLSGIVLNAGKVGNDSKVKSDSKSDGQKKD